MYNEQYLNKVVDNVKKILDKNPYLSELKMRRALIWRYWVDVQGLRPPFRQYDWLNPERMVYPDTITRAIRLIVQKKSEGGEIKW